MKTGLLLVWQEAAYRLHNILIDNRILTLQLINKQIYP